MSNKDKNKKKSELAIKELEEAYKTYIKEETDNMYGYTDEEYAYGGPSPSWASSWTSSWTSSSPVFDASMSGWENPDEIIYAHGELEIGTLVKHNNDVGVIMSKIDIGVSDEVIENLKKSGVSINAVSLDNFFGSWDFKHGYDNNFYSVALAGKTKKIFTIGWKLKEISKEK